MKLPAVGAPAPDFTLPSTSGSDLTLSELRGRNVLLAFFPAAFTGVCTAEMCAFSEDYDTFTSKDTVVLPVSVDNVASLKEFKRKEGLAVELLSDLKRDVSRAYGTFNEQYFVSGRAYVLIDRKGIVRWTFGEVTPATRRENGELLAQLAALG